jgi:hypothetical protein
VYFNFPAANDQESSNFSVQHEVHSNGGKKEVELKSKTLKKLLADKGLTKAKKDRESKMVLSIFDSDIVSTIDDSATNNKKQTNMSITIDEEMGISLSDSDNGKK